MSRSEERMGLKSGWFLTVIPYSVSMPMTFGMAMRFLAPWRTETPGPGQGKDEGGAPPPSRSRLQILSGIDDALDAPLLLLGLAHQRLHVDDPLTLLPRDLRPVVGGRGVRQGLVLLELLAGGGLEVLGGDALGAAAREEFKENEDLPNTTNPDDWAKIAGKKGERIVYVKPLMGESKEKQRSVERIVNTGQYL